MHQVTKSATEMQPLVGRKSHKDLEVNYTRGLVARVYHLSKTLGHMKEEVQKMNKV